MADERLFLDTVFIQALLNRRDQYHLQAISLLPHIRNAREVWITEAILIIAATAEQDFLQAGYRALLLEP